MHKKLETPINPNLLVSEMAETLIGSEIIRLAGEINEKIKNGEKIYNLTIGDFDPHIFPIPAELELEIIKAYKEKETNYPPANGIAPLRNAVSEFIKTHGELIYDPEEILIAAGARPLIYATFQTIVQPGDTVIFPIPSWNNNHYTHLSRSKPAVISASPENNFMPKAKDIEPYIQEASLISLCSPLNPSGTMFNKEDLTDICNKIVEENNRRDDNQRPVYLLYDRIYNVLTFGNYKHYDPITLNPEMRNYTISIDGISKSFAATGVRVGWAFGPQRIIDKMKSILSHLGAWASKAEQVAVAKYLMQKENVNRFLTEFKSQVQDRLNAFYEGIMSLKSEGHNVDAIAPQAAIYLTVKLALHGVKKPDGSILNTTRDITKYILEEAKIALVPFSAFGDSDNSAWYRLSVGTCKMEEVEKVINSLKEALEKLK
jgi:aspartate aminotransferase